MEMKNQSSGKITQIKEISIIKVSKMKKMWCQINNFQQRV